MIDPRFSASTAKLIAFSSHVFVILIDAEEDVDPLFSLSRLCWCWWSAATPDVVEFTRCMCACFRFERWLFLSEITHSFHACAQGVDASMVVSFGRGRCQSLVSLFVRMREPRGSFKVCGESKVFPESFRKMRAREKRQNFKAREKEEEEIQQQQQRQNFTRVPFVWKKQFYGRDSNQDADIERGGCVRELDDSTGASVVESFDGCAVQRYL